MHDRASDYVNDSLKVEDVDEPMQNVYQHGSADNSYENINFVVQAVEQELSKSDLNLVNLEQSATALTVREDTQLNHQKYYIDTMYEDIGQSNSEQDLIVPETVDEPEEETEEISPNLPAQGRKKTSNPAGVFLFKCKLCQFTNRKLYHLKLHLQSHLQDRPFACPKCNGTFTQRGSMVTHLGYCDGVISKNALKQEVRHNKKVSKLGGIPLTLKDMQDPVKLKKYYTVIEIGGQNNDSDEDANALGYNCTLCSYTNVAMSGIKHHLEAGHKKSVSQKVISLTLSK